MAVAGALLFGGVVATAPSAAAVGSERCTKNDADHWRTITDLGVAPIRSGPAQGYSVRYTMEFAQHFRAECSTVNRHGNTWFYGKGEFRSTKGWIYGARTEKGHF
ncbi:hypothetical protein [Streptomyces sp. V4I8]|uniref:hypothetical protein n=1 Tax=Streptomyces sp. V4I8 TaxID=3156469 RepID=UPI00351743D5